MQCQISGRSLRDFAKSVQCMSKIGDDLHIESVGRELHLRAVSSSRSAFASVTFGQQYFDSIQRTHDDGALRCKVLVKSCHNIFKSLPNVEKSVERCTISLKPALCRLVFQLMCKFNITKTINLDFQDSDILQAVYSREQSTNRIAVQAPILIEFLSMFHPTIDEVTLVAEPTQLRFKSYVEPGMLASDAARTLHTEVAVDTGDLDQYDIAGPVAITFCLREFKAILAFCEAVRLPIAISFGNPGSPVIFSTSDNVAIKAEFVLATLQEDSDVHFGNAANAARTNRPSNEVSSNAMDTTSIATPHGRGSGDAAPNSQAVRHFPPSQSSMNPSQGDLRSAAQGGPSGMFTSTPLTGHTVVQRQGFMGLTSPAVGPRTAPPASGAPSATQLSARHFPDVGAASFDGGYGPGSMDVGYTTSIAPPQHSMSQASDATAMDVTYAPSNKRPFEEESFVGATPPPRGESDAEDEYVEATPPRKRAKVFSDEESD